MIFSFHLTEKMVEDIKSGRLNFASFSVRNNGKNYQIEMESEEAKGRDRKSKENQREDKNQKKENIKSEVKTNIEFERLTDILERYGCAWQEDN